MEEAGVKKLQDLSRYLTLVTGAHFASHASDWPGWPSEGYEICGFGQAKQVWSRFTRLTKDSLVLIIAHDWSRTGEGRDLCYLGKDYATLQNHEQVAHNIFFRPENQSLDIWLRDVLPDKTKLVSQYDSYIKLAHLVEQSKQEPWSSHFSVEVTAATRIGPFGADQRRNTVPRIVKLKYVGRDDHQLDIFAKTSTFSCSFRYPAKRWWFTVDEFYSFVLDKDGNLAERLLAMKDELLSKMAAESDAPASSTSEGTENDPQKTISDPTEEQSNSRMMSEAEIEKLGHLRSYLARITQSLFKSNSGFPHWPHANYEVCGFGQPEEHWPNFIRLINGSFVLVLAYDRSGEGRDLCYLGKGYATESDHECVAHTIFARPKNEHLTSWLERVLPEKTRRVLCSAACLKLGHLVGQCRCGPLGEHFSVKSVSTTNIAAFEDHTNLEPFRVLLEFVGHRQRKISITTTYSSLFQCVVRYLDLGEEYTFTVDNSNDVDLADVLLTKKDELLDKFTVKRTDVERRLEAASAQYRSPNQSTSVEQTTSQGVSQAEGTAATSSDQPTSSTDDHGFHVIGADEVKTDGESEEDGAEEMADQDYASEIENQTPPGDRENGVDHPTSHDFPFTLTFNLVFGLAHLSGHFYVVNRATIHNSCGLRPYVPLTLTVVLKTGDKCEVVGNLEGDHLQPLNKVQKRMFGQWQIPTSDLYDELGAIRLR